MKARSLLGGAALLALAVAGTKPSRPATAPAPYRDPDDISPIGKALLGVVALALVLGLGALVAHTHHSDIPRLDGDTISFGSRGATLPFLVAFVAGGLSFLFAAIFSTSMKLRSLAGWTLILLAGGGVAYGVATPFVVAHNDTQTLSVYDVAGVTGGRIVDADTIIVFSASGTVLCPVTFSTDRTSSALGACELVS